MKYTNKQLKSNARASLLGHYGTVIGAFIFAELIVGLINIPFNQMTQQGLNYGAPARAILGAAGSLVVSVVSMLFGVGLAHIHLQIARGQQTRFSELFFVFKSQPDRYIAYSVVIMLISIVCVLPGTIVCIITSASSAFMVVGGMLLLIGSVVLLVLSLGLALTPYILLDNPSMRLADCLKLSLDLMKGQKLRLFLLQLSFLGWMLFAILSFGIALLWISPYMSQTITWFYMGFITE